MGWEGRTRSIIAEEKEQSPPWPACKLANPPPGPTSLGEPAGVTIPKRKRPWFPLAAANNSLVRLADAMLGIFVVRDCVLCSRIASPSAPCPLEYHDLRRRDDVTETLKLFETMSPRALVVHDSTLDVLGAACPDLTPSIG